MKGLDETIKKWQILKRRRFVEEMKGCELHITSPGYGKEQYMFVRENFAYDKSIVFLDDLPPRELAKYMATCEGLFYVNTFNETFGAVCAIADAVGCKVHVLCKNELSGCPEAVGSDSGSFVTDIEMQFDAGFIENLGDFRQEFHAPKDFRVSTVLPRWLAALKLESTPSSGVSEAQVQAGLQVIRDTDVLRYTAHEGFQKAMALVGQREYRKELKNEAEIDAEGAAGGARRITKADQEELRRTGVDRGRPGGVEAAHGCLPQAGSALETTKTGPAVEAPGVDTRRNDETQNGGKAMASVTPTVCLVMLVKGAESTLKRALDSVRGFVDHAVFQFDDEPSSEAMKDIISDCFLGTTISYAFTFRPWVNFSVNRNLLLDSERANFGDDYVLTLDADDEFVRLNEFDKSRLTLDSFDVLIEDGGMIYPRLMLWRGDRGFKYHAPAHEYLSSEVLGLTTGTLPNVRYIRHGQSLSPETHREKYLRDVRLFVAELKKNPDDTRSMYYLAQSLKDASCGTDEVLLRQALKIYQSRAKMAGFQDERFLSFMEAGRLKRRFKEAESAIVNCFLEAAAVIPDRKAEPVYEIMHYYNNEGGSKEKAIKAAAGVALPKTLPSGFCVDVAVYQWQFKFQYALALFYTGMKDQAKALFEELLTLTPETQHKVLRANIAFCEPPIVVETAVLDELEANYGEPPKLMAFDRVDGSTTTAPSEAMAIPRTAGASASVPWFTPKQ
jgi:hypothetical protein